jgi:hypothetical protein
MPFVLLFVGILFFVVAIQGTQGTLFSLMKSEFVGSNSFVVWAAALVILGLLGYIKPIRPITHAFLLLVLIVMVLAGGSKFFTNFNSGIRSPAAPASGDVSGTVNPIAQPAAGSGAGGLTPVVIQPGTSMFLPQGGIFGTVSH